MESVISDSTVLTTIWGGFCKHEGRDISRIKCPMPLSVSQAYYSSDQGNSSDFRQGHGKVLQQVLGFFSLGKIRTFDVEDPTLKYWKVASQFALLPEVQSWREDSTDSRVLWVATPPMLDPTSLFSTLRSQIQQEDQFRPPVFIRVDTTLYRHDELSEAQILSNMCAQMLRQQPHLASALQDHLLNVQDAAVGDHKLWQQRALWSCLRVLLYCPKDADTFCFIDATSSSHTKALAAELGPLLEASEMGLRLMVACRSARGQTPNVLTKYNVDLADEDFHEPLRQDLEEWIRESLEVGLPDASWQEALLMQMLSSGDFRLAHLALGFFASTPAWLTKWSINSIWTTLASQSTAESLIEDNIRRHGRWLLVPMLWALEAFEPNRIDEINVALKLNDDDVDGTVEDVINLLPGVLTTRGGALVLAEQVQPALEHLWSKYFAPTQSHAYLAECCVIVLTCQYRADPAIPQTDELELPDAAARLCAYAATNWLRHFILGEGSGTVYHASHPCDITGKEDETASPKKLVDVSQAFFDDSGLSTFWISHLRRAQNLDGLDKELCHLILPETLQGRLGIGKTRALQVSQQLAIMRLSSNRDVTDSLLVIGTEADDMNIVQASLSADPSPSEHTLSYAVAAASGLIRETLFQAIGESSDDILYWALLTSICFGNRTATEDLLGRLTVKIRVGNDTTLETSTIWWPQANESLETAEMLRHTPLGMATAYGDANLVDLLLHHDISWWDLDERRPPTGTWNALHHAAVGGQHSIMSKLLLHMVEGVADIPTKVANTVTESGNTPLTLAASRGFYDIVGCLLKHSKGQPWTKGYWVDVNAQNHQKYNALLAAARYGFSQTLETLLACEGIDYSKTDGASAGILHLALANNRATTASRILDRKDMFSNETESREVSRAASPVNEDDDDSFSESSNDTTQVVLNAAPRPKISLRQKDRSGHTPLVIAIRRNLKFIVRSLVEMGAEINYFPEEPNAPLLAAAEVGSLELVTMLTGMGAKLDMDTTGFTTPLHVACTMGYLDVARELLKGSADQLSQRDGTQRTPFGAAITRGQSHIIDFLIDLQTREGLWEGLWAAAISGKAHIVDRLLRDGAKIDAQDSYGNTALQGAAYYDYPRCVERLILRGARLGLVDCDDINALGDAARAGSAESLELLVNAGVNVDAETGGETALCRAIWAEEAECVDVLLQGGAKLVLSSTLAEHETVLNFAVEHSTPEIVRLLLEESEGEGLAKALKIALQTDSTSQLEVLMEFYDPAKVDLGSGRTILHLAAEGSLAGLAKVLEHATGRAALNSGPKKVGTPLEIAACSLKSSLDKVKYLHNEAALVGVVQPAGRFGTPLNAASYSRNVPVVEYLIRQMQQEDINASGTHYGNAIQNTLAEAWKDVDLSSRLLDILLEAGVPTTPASADRHGTALHTAALYGPKTLVEKILNINRALADEGDGLGQLPIHLSAFQGDWESMMLLTTSTSTIRSVDKMGRNAVHLAAAAGACLVLEEVFATNENMDLLLAPDLDGWTPLHWACRSVDDDGVRFLIEKAQEAFGPAWDIMTDDLLTKDEKRWTPLDVARFHQRTELELLLSLGMTTSDAESWEPDRSRHLGSDCDSCSCVSASHSIMRWEVHLARGVYRTNMAAVNLARRVPLHAR